MMARSSEYPELKFVEARSYGRGRDGKSVMFSVIHYTAGSERATSAEDGADYDARRTDGTSTHQFHDRDSTVQCVLTKDMAHAARHRGNRLGIQHELCGTAQTREQWLDAASYGTLQQAAKWVAEDCRKYDLPVRRLTVAETRRAWTEYPHGPKGIVGHVDCTLAFPEDGGDHTDPGKDFPWDIFLDMVRAELEDDMTPDQLLDALETPRGQALLAKPIAKPAGVGVHNQKLGRSDVTIGQSLESILALLRALAGKDFTDEPAIVAGVLAGLDPAAIAAAIPADLAQRVAEELSTRLAA